MKADTKSIGGKYYIVISSEIACGPWGNIPITEEFHPSAAERFARHILDKVKEARNAERRQVKRFFDPGYQG